MRKNKRSPAVFIRKPTVVATQVALAVFAQVAYAQQAVQTADRVERVEVTGSRLPAISTEGTSPVTTVTSQEIQLDGLSKTEDILLNLPQVNASQTSVQANGATGTANVNLRNLGPTRNLVLVNGRRLPAGTPQSGQFSAAADLNQIPAPLIQRVEVLTGGASAVYGSDAITGVVNFIMNDRFEGLQVDLYHSFYNHQQHNPSGVQEAIRARGGALIPAGEPGAGTPVPASTGFTVPGNVGSDGAVNGVSFTMGKNFADNKGNATVFFGYKKENEVSQKNRDFSACSLDDGDQLACAGSSTTFPGRFRTFNTTTGATGPNFTIADAAGTTRRYLGDPDAFNFGPYNFFRRPSEQTSFNAFAHLDINPKVRAYTELGFHDNKTDATIAPGGIFFGDPIVTIHGDNPLLSPSARALITANNFGNPFATATDSATLLIGRRDVEGLPRTDSLRHTSYRAVLGAKGDVTPVWSYDTYFQTSEVIFSDFRTGFFDKAKIQRAMDVTTDPGTGAAVCRSVLDGSDPNCVPYDIWHIGGPSQAAINYLHTPALQTGNTMLRQFGATATADLGKYGAKLPSARDGIGLVLGYERRKEALTLNTDAELTSFGLSGAGGPQIGVSGHLESDEFFGEARLPIAQRVPFADLLSLNGSYRRSNYSDGKDTNTYGIGVEWAPVRAYRFRGSYQHAIRHANVNELFQPQGQNLFGLSIDPCDATFDASGTVVLAPPKATLAQCARSGVTAAQYGSGNLTSPAGQYNFIQGGNPDLNPEKAKTYTLGLVMNPVRNLTASIDWYNIKVEDAIGANPAFVLAGCLNSGANCNLVHRDVAGTLWQDPLTGFVTALNTNLGSYQTSGVDLAASYTMRMGNLGGFGITGLVSYLQSWKFEPIKGAGQFDCAGLYGPVCSETGGPNPKWKSKVRGTWSTPFNVDLALTWRHISEVKFEATSSDPNLGLVGTTFPTNEKLAARDYFDIGANWTINKTFSLRAGVNNIFDKDPPIVGSGTSDPSIFGNGNTFPGTYDALGRLIFMNLTMKF